MATVHSFATGPTQWNSIVQQSVSALVPVCIDDSAFQGEFRRPTHATIACLRISYQRLEIVRFYLSKFGFPVATDTQ